MSSITISDDVTTMGGYVFSDWESNQTIIVPFSSEENKPENWDTNWNGSDCIVEYSDNT